MSSTFAPYTGRRYVHLAILLASVTAIGPFCIDTYLPSFPEIGISLHATPLEVQQTLTAFLLPYAFMSLWHGSISDAVGRRPVALISLSLFALASVGCIFAQSITELLVFRALQGTVIGAGMVVVRAMVRDLFDGQQAQRLMAQITVMFALAPAVAPIIGGWLHVWFGWRSVFVFMLSFAVLLLVWCYYALPETLPSAQRQALHPAHLARSYKNVLTRLPFLGAAFALSLNFMGLFVYVTAAPVFLLQHLHVKETEFAWLFIPSTAGMMIGSWVSSHFAGKWTPQATIRRGFLLMGGASIINVLFHTFFPAQVPWSVAPMLIFTMGMTLTMPSLTLLGLDLFPEHRGLAASCQAFIQSLGGALTAAVIAPIVSTTALTLALSQLGLLGAGWIIAHLALPRLLVGHEGQPVSAL